MKMKLSQETIKMNASEYKKYHESFMENNHGSTLLHTVSYVFFIVQCSIYCSISSCDIEYRQYMYEYIHIVIPLIFSYTILSDNIYILNLCVFTMILYNLIKQWNKFEIQKVFSLPNSFKTRRIQSISCMRGLTYLITVFSILAVDFKNFPRYMAKTERFGYSVMDTGVGLFVLMSGLVHKDICKDNYVSIIKGNIKFISIVILLGVARFISVKQLEYHEHVTEYGVHWNFFFTLAVCKLFSVILLFCSNHKLFLSVLVLMVHELLLYKGMQNWVFSNIPRNNILAANREGISSCLGYTSLYLFSAYLKDELLNCYITRSRVMMKLVFGTVFLWTVSYFINIYLPTSRLLANTAYCTYLEAVLVTVTTVMYFLEVLYQNKNLNFQIPLIVSAINNNGLIFFLAGNLLTGLINLSFRTLLLMTSNVIIILNMYMVITIGLTVYLNKLGIKI